MSSATHTALPSEAVVTPGPSPRTPSGRVRPLSEDDLPQMTRLYERVFGRNLEGSADSLRQLFFEQPWHDASLPSLGYQSETGQIVGCLGVMPRHMTFRGRPVRVAVGHHFAVDPSSRNTLAGFELARHFYAGPQDVTLAEGNEFSRQMCQFFGGSVSVLYSLCWTRPLRLAQYALMLLKNRGLPDAAALTLRPLCRSFDSRLPHPNSLIKTSAVLADDLDPVTMLACLSTFTNGRSLQPVYDLPSLTWLMKMLAQKRHRGLLNKVVVRTRSGRPLGWYLYYLVPRGVAEVVQVGGPEESIREVLEHLFHHAWERGAVAVTGAMDPSLSRALFESHCVFHRPDNCWMLVHSRDRRILNAIQAGDAFLTRLEGEWWIAS